MQHVHHHFCTLTSGPLKHKIFITTSVLSHQVPYRNTKSSSPLLYSHIRSLTETQNLHHHFCTLTSGPLQKHKIFITTSVLSHQVPYRNTKSSSPLLYSHIRSLTETQNLHHHFCPLTSGPLQKHKIFITTSVLSHQVRYRNTKSNCTISK